MAEQLQRTYHTNRGRILFTPGDPVIEKRAPARLPEPPFRRRQPRPSSIHIVRFPPGYVWCPPPDPPPPASPSQLRLKFNKHKAASKTSAKRAITSILSPFASPFAATFASASVASSIRSLSPDLSRSNSRSEPYPPSYESLRPHSIALPVVHSNTLSTIDEATSAPNMQSLPSRPRGSISSEHRGSISSISGVATTSSQADLHKPLASAGGVSMDIELAEPHVYLTGFDHDGRGHHQTQNATAMIRGKLVLTVTKAIKIKAVTLTFMGRARTEWPEGIPPMKSEYFEEKALRKNVMPFFNTAFDDTDNPYGAQCKYTLKGADGMSSSRSSLNNGEASTRSSRSSTLLSAKDAKRLSLQTNQSRSFEKNTPSNGLSSTMTKGYKLFHPGTYEYSFEIPLEHTSPETIDLPLGSVKWMLESLIERAGTFKPNLHGTKEVLVVRAPDQNSLEQVEPIAISRKWEDQLHYDIVISGKSFPIGAKIPIAFKLTPLAKVQCHRIKVFVTENADYFTDDKKVTRRDAQRKILLFERQAGKPLAEQYKESSVNFIRGGEPSSSTRQRTREVAQRRKDREAAHRGRLPEPIPEQTDNLLGDIDLGLDELAIATEIEMNVQLPTCAQMRKDRSKMIHPDTTWKLIQVHHWIKIVLRLSRIDTDDPSGTKRRHFEISIDSPFHILSCLATQQHTSLPEYSDLSSPTASRTFECGCSDAPSTGNSSPSSSTSMLPTLDSLASNGAAAIADSGMPAMPTQAHLSDNGGVQRPIHLLRAPSFNPPAFDADEPPPPLPTPPPGYDMVIGTPSHDGLADYFARFADAYSDDDHTDDEDIVRGVSRNGRVNVPNPRTPGGRRNRSMDINRNFMFRPEDVNKRLQNSDGQQGTAAMR